MVGPNGAVVASRRSADGPRSSRTGADVHRLGNIASINMTIDKRTRVESIAALTDLNWGW